jgi:hypothetical protein
MQIENDMCYLIGSQQMIRRNDFSFYFYLCLWL